MAILLAGCSSTADAPRDPTIEVAASFYPLADAARRIGGDCVSVENLTPPGVEPHDRELTPDDIEAIASADVVVLLGGGFQPAVNDAVGDAEGTVVDVLEAVDAATAKEEDALDPHVWLDPELFATSLPPLAQALSRAAPQAPCDFAANAADMRDDLVSLDAMFASGLASCQRDVIVTSHAAFGYLAAAYGLNQEAISGIEPTAEPSAGRIAQLRDLVRRAGVTTIFTEELVSPEVAETLATEAGVTTAVLNTLEGLTEEQLAAGEDYFSVMRSNLETLREALGCA